MDIRRFIVMTVLTLSGIGICVQAISAEDIKELTDQSQKLAASGVIKETTVLQPERMSSSDKVRLDEWEIMPGTTMVLFSPQSLPFIPAVPAYVKDVARLAEENGKKGSEMLRVFSIRVGENPQKTCIVNAHREELSIISYNATDKLVYFLDIRDLGINIRPALFFSKGEDSTGTYFNILIVDEDKVSTLHREEAKYTIVKFYPGQLKISVSGEIEKGIEDLYPWKGPKSKRS